MDIYLEEVEARLLALKPKSSRWSAEDYIGGGESSLRYLDLKIPLVRAEFKKGFSFSHLAPKYQWPIWNYVWQHSQIFEVMLLASFWAGSRPIVEMAAHQRLIVGWLARVDNWAHSDELSAHFAALLEHDFKKFAPIFRKWNCSRKPWIKRQSLVGLLYYSRMRAKIPPAEMLLRFIDRHIDDDHYYVQKGVGWALREAWNVYPRETFKYLRVNAGRIPPAGWTAATEKLSKREKDLLKKVRAAWKKRQENTVMVFS